MWKQNTNTQVFGELLYIMSFDYHILKYHHTKGERLILLRCGDISLTIAP